MAYHHLSVVVHRQAEKYGDRVALKYRDYDVGRWNAVSWNEFSQTVRLVSDALLALGVEVQENVGIFSQNMPECLYVDFGAYAVRAVTVPLYATGSPAQVQYILNDAHIRFLFVGEQYQYDTALRVAALCPALRRVVIFDRKVRKDSRDRSLSVYFDEFLAPGRGLPRRSKTEARTASVSSADIANILYTSGTTGDPKGVMLMHSNYMEAFRTHEIRIPSLTDRDVSLSFLPLTHVFERGWTYVCLQRGAQVCINLRPQDVLTSLREIRPTVMCSVPRFWEKVYRGVHERIGQASGPKRALMLDAIRTGRRHNLDYLRLGKTPPLTLRLKYRFYEKTVLAFLKKTLGIEHGTLFPTAGAAVSDEVCEFVLSAGIRMMVGYGLTESTATVSCFPPEGFVPGSVGEIMPGLEVKTGAGGEILLRGKTVTPGYYRNPAATADAIDKDGWFHTGDAGRLEGRVLYLTGRIKELFKTSNGKYICPQALETRFAIDRYIDQAAVIADGRRFVSALIVPVYGLVEAYAREQGIAFGSREELLAHPAIQALYRIRIDTLQQQFAHYEQVKRFALLPAPFSMERGELTDTLKLRRPVVAQNYKDIIDRMYEDPSPTPDMPFPHTPRNVDF